MVMQEYNAMLLGKNGKLYSIGVNTNGQLSQGNVNNLSEYSIMYNSDETEVKDCMLLPSKGSTYTNVTQKTNTIIRTNGTVAVVGNNTYGQFGLSLIHI